MVVGGVVHCIILVAGSDSVPFTWLLRFVFRVVVLLNTGNILRHSKLYNRYIEFVNVLFDIIRIHTYRSSPHYNRLLYKISKLAAKPKTKPKQHKTQLK